MAKKVLKVVKADQTVHFLPLTAKTQVLAQNNLLAPHQRWTITEVDESLSLNHPWKEKPGVTGAAAEIISQKDKEITELKKLLKEKGAGKVVPITGTGSGSGSGAGGSSVTEKSTSLKADQAIAQIATLTSAADVTAFTEGESRVSVIKAADNKLATF